MKKYISYLLSIVIISLMIPCTVTQAAKINGKTLTSQGACVMDYETGEILYEYNGYKKRVPASMTKIMNMYIIYEALANGEISLDTVVPISNNVYNKSRNSVYQSVLPLYYNKTYTVDEMINVIVVYSASGAAIAMAELIGGTEEAYVERMNNKAKEMGIDAIYYDSCGIKENKITPVGMATLARNIIRDYPDILVRSSKKSVTFHGNKYKTTNHLLDTYYYEGADGLKTGTTSAAGYCFCGTAVRNGKRMISVTMSSASTGERFTDTAKLLDYGFSVAPQSKENIFFTDMSTYINGNEIPTFAYKGENDVNYAVIIAEDLANYGFDVNYDSNNKTLYLSYNKNKPINPMSIDYYKDKKDILAYPVTQNDISVILNDGITEYNLSNIHNLDGYVCFDVEELGKMYDFLWVNDIRSSKINVYSKENEQSSDNNSLIHFTDISTYINGYEVPTFMYNGNNPHAVIIAEDLSNYGFDIDFSNGTLYLKYNANKDFTPVPTDNYKGKKDEIAYNIVPNTVKTFLIDGLNDYELKDIYNVNGSMCISVDEFGKLYNFTWSEENRAVYINTEISKVATLPDGSQLTSGSAYIMNYNTGEEMYAYNAEEQKPVASIAKMMSVYVILDAIENGEISLDTIVPISENVYDLSRNPNYKMMVNLEYDEEYTVDEMIDMIIIFSSAACVTAVAELLCGTEEEFVKRMNNKAQEIGIDSVFYNGTGVCLNPETDKENMMSAKEVAVMTRHMIQNYPDIVERTKCSSVEFHGETYYNLNKMFTDFYYKGADGFKNGMTEASGYCMCGTAIIDGKRLITVTLPSDSNEARFTDTAKMFTYGFNTLGVDTSDVYKVPGSSSDTSTSKSEVTEYEGNTININIDGNYEMKFSKSQPFIKDGVLMVPIKEMLEILKKKVEWDSTSNEIVISDGVVSLRLKAGIPEFKIETRHAISNEVTKTEDGVFDIAPVTINGVSYCPLIETLYEFGITCTYDYDNDQYLIIAGVC